MTKGVLVALGIMVVGVATIPIPPVHWVVPWLSPFAAGFAGVGAGNVHKDKIAGFVLVTTGILAVPSAVLGALILVNPGDFLPDFIPSFTGVLALALIPVAMFGITAGSVIRFMVDSDDKTSK